MRTDRNAFTIVEVLVAMAVLTALLIPALEMLRPSALAVPAVASLADALVASVASTLGEMGSEALSTLVEKGEPAAHDFRKVALEAFPFRAGRASTGHDHAGLDPHLFLRLDRNAGGQFGLDRIDVKLSYRMSGKPRWVSRSVIKRNHPQLVALSQIRMHGPVERLSAEEFRDSMSYAVLDYAYSGQTGGLAGSPFRVPVYPSFLAAFEGRVKDSALLDERKSRMEGFGDDLSGSDAYFEAVEGSTPPSFASNTRICN